MYDLHLPIHPSYRVFEKTMLVQKLHSNRKVCQVIEGNSPPEGGEFEALVSL